MPLAAFTYEAESTTPEQVRQALLEAGEYLGGLTALTPETRGAGYRDDVRSAVDRINSLDPLLTAMERAMAPTPVGAGPMGATLPVGQNPGNMSAGDLVINAAEYQSFAQARSASTSYLEIGLPGSLFASNDNPWRQAQGQERATITADPTASSSGSVWLPVGQPWQTPPIVRQMRLFLRDVLHVQQTGLASVPYIREVNPAASEFGASAVAENSAKPEVAMDWTPDDAPARKIAAWVPATEEAIDDAPTLRGYVDNRLTYLLAVREEYEILNGSGTTPHLKGILQYADLQSNTGTDKFVVMGLAQSKIENVDGEADGIAMNPTDFWTAITTRQSTRFDGEGFTQGGAVPPFGNVGNIGIWGLPVVRSRALPVGTAIVGAWRMGATLFDRMQTVIKVGNQHNDFFINNKIVILAEERVALAVHRPDFFVKCTFT